MDNVLRLGPKDQALRKLRFRLKDNPSSHKSLVALKYDQDLRIEFELDQETQGWGNNLTPSSESLIYRLRSDSSTSNGYVKIRDQIKISQDSQWIGQDENQRLQFINDRDKAIIWTISPVSGCGPNWIHDQDLRN